MFPNTRMGFDSETGHGDRRPAQSGRSSFGSTAKMDFPKFDGEDYQVWFDNCELYFDIYGVSDHMKVKFASLNVIGNAALWLKMAQKRKPLQHWDELRAAVAEKWGKDKHQFYMRQLLLLSQIGSVAEYTTKFDTLRHQILLADPHTHEVLFVERYIAGLRPDIRSAIVLHRPKSVDTASCLALLQEVEVEHDKSLSAVKQGSRSYNKSSAEKKQGVSASEDSRKWSEKLEALRAYRKSKNLCFTCGYPWARSHKCPDKVPIHVMEELLEILQLDDPPDPQHLSDSSSDEEVMLLARDSGSTPQVKRRTMRLHGRIGSREVLILVDSGANCSFVDTAIVDELQLPVQQTKPASYVVAGGGTLMSSQMVNQLSWWTQGHTFCQDMKVLPLGCYDIIIGADWLEQHSPMWVHLHKKWMKFTHEGRRISLRGIQDTNQHLKPVSAGKLKGLLRRGAIQQVVQIKRVQKEKELCSVADTVPTPDPLPPEVATVLQEYKDVFTEPSTLPPQRLGDHKIPLIPGTQPVSVRPYRYTPQQKDEIQRQVKEMLRKGIIRPSSSPFASPVLLICKKDGSW
ncbi:uncharacterized protein [Aegilops tauschii subsp. strangulata]|uniref:uncharacterized protein n=1 Tax=Aegilops tauschii subsp. strangulata TaxID=200361 RepID=UPI003CC86030